MIDENLNDEDNENYEGMGIRITSYNNIVDRYFTKYYVDQGTDKEQYIFIHTNGMVMCGLGRNNFIVKSQARIKEIKDLNKLKAISGKKKHGAHVLMDNEYILQFVLERENSINTDEKDIIYNYSPKVKGKIVEINSNIWADPQLVKNQPEKYGFICFLLITDPKTLEILKEKLEKNK